MTHDEDERLRRVAADMYDSEKRRGWLNDPTQHADPHLTEQDYVERFIERHSGADVGALEEMADIVRPSNVPTAYERSEHK
jgi:hypothetical protein